MTLSNTQEDTLMTLTPYTKYKSEIIFLSNTFKVFTSDMLMALLLYNNKELPKDKTDIARILSSYASQKLIAKTSIFRRSDLITNNSIPRMCWTKYGRDVK
jgi:hypothetical protein